MNIHSNFKISAKLEACHHQSEKKPLICVICGASARGFNFGAITCMSCKIFFRRNALTKFSRFACQQGGHCEINEQTRRHCTSCRLRRCFQMGMRKELIRPSKNVDSSGKRFVCSIDSWEKKTYDQIPWPFTQWSCHSSSSQIHWFFLHRLSTAFDSLTSHIGVKVQQMSEHWSKVGIQPLKLRLKASPIYELIYPLTSTALRFIQFIPHITFLSPPNKRTLVARHSRLLIMYYIHYQMNLGGLQRLTQCSWWNSSLNCIFSRSTRDLFGQINTQIALICFRDSYLIQLILIILIFTGSSLEDPSECIDQSSYTLTVHQMQNLYIDLLWKYMLYRFGESYSIYLFSLILQTILRVENLITMIDRSEKDSERKWMQILKIIIKENLPVDS